MGLYHLSYYIIIIQPNRASDTFDDFFIQILMNLCNCKYCLLANETVLNQKQNAVVQHYKSQHCLTY